MVGIIISGSITGIIIYNVISIVVREKIIDNTEFIKKIHGNTVLYYIINIFLIASFYIMIAGFAAFFKQEYKIPTCIISSILGVVMYIILTNKVDWIIKTNSAVVPVLIVIVIFVCNRYSNIKVEELSINIMNRNIISCIFDAVLYSSYNSLLLIPMLIPLTQYVKNRKQNVILSILTATIIIFLAIGIYGVMIKNTNIQSLDMPIIAMVQKKHEKVLYAIAIEIAIFTSAIAAGYGVLENLNKTICNNNYYKIIVAIMCILGIPISAIGFGNLINSVYPVFGLLGLIQIVLILKNNIEKNFNN